MTLTSVSLRILQVGVSILQFVTTIFNLSKCLTTSIALFGRPVDSAIALSTSIVTILYCILSLVSFKFIICIAALFSEIALLILSIAAIVSEIYLIIWDGGCTFSTYKKDPITNTWQEHKITSAYCITRQVNLALTTTLIIFNIIAIFLLIRCIFLATKKNKEPLLKIKLARGLLVREPIILRELEEQSEMKNEIGKF